MSEVVLKAESRETVKGLSTVSMRKQGWIPVNFYGYKIENRTMVVQEMDLLKAIRSGSKVIQLETAEGKKEVVIKEVQRHPVTWKPLHADFYALADDREIVLKVPVRFEGVSFGVKNMGGVLILSSRSIEISCLPKFIPNELVVDVSPLKVRDTVHAKDLKLENIRVVSRGDQLMCRVGATRASLSEAGGDKGVVKGKAKK